MLFIIFIKSIKIKKNMKIKKYEKQKNTFWFEKKTPPSIKK